MISKLALGTAQFGLTYGISNTQGKTSSEELSKILKFATKQGVRVIDTAPGYGDSELAIGKSMPEGANFRITTKTSKSAKAETLERILDTSLRNLGVSSVAGLLFHDSRDLLFNEGEWLFKAALRAKASGKVEQVGVSVYSAEEIDETLRRFAIDQIQVPLSVLDQRLLASGHLARLKKKGVEIHVRSAFLQGLLLMEPEKLHPYFSSVRNHLRDFSIANNRAGISAVQACLDFAFQIPEVDAIVCGLNNCAQLEELCEIAASPRRFSVEYYKRFAWSDPKVLNPSLWRLQ